MRRFYDITHTVTPSLVVWPGDTPVRFERIRETGDESRSTVSRLTLSSHAGTHVDAPAHFLPGGGTVDRLNIDILIGSVRVLETDASALTREVLGALPIPEGCRRVIFKTANSRRWTGVEPFFEDYVGVTRSGAAWLVERGIGLVGLDYLSIAAHSDILEVHQLLLGAEVVLLETLDLREVPAGSYDLVCLPLKLEGLDGSPARAVLIAEDDVPPLHKA